MAEPALEDTTSEEAAAPGQGEIEVEIEAEPAPPPEAEPEPGTQAEAEAGSEAEPGAGTDPATSPLSNAIAALQQARAADRDRLLRLAAEYENFKKRSKRDSRESVKRAEDRVVLEFLPVVDNLERALAHTGSDDVGAEAAGLMDGVRMVHKQFLSTLEKYDIKPFESVGQPFAPERHEAVQQMPSDEPPNTVCRELQRGYLRGDHLVRPAMVIVSTGPAVAAAAGEEGEGTQQVDGAPTGSADEEEP